MKTLLRITLVSLVLLTCQARGSEKLVIGGLDGLNPYDTARHYPVLLALSGGGARGLATVGMLRAFEEKGIRIAAIAGVSMGGIIGGLYASGMSTYELVSMANKLKFDELFADSPARLTMFLTQREERERHIISIRFNGWLPVIPRALTKGQQLTSLLTDLTTKASYYSGADFTRLPIPFKTVSSDIVSGRAVVMERGSMPDAMRATMAYPLAFTPVDKDGQLLMDGGMLMPVPVDLVREMSDTVDFVVAINTTSDLLAKDDLLTPLDIAGQVTSVMMADKLAAQLAKADYVITPPIEDFKSTSFGAIDSLVDIGYQCGLTAADSIISLLEQTRHSSSFFVASVQGNDAPDSTVRQLDSEFNGRLWARDDLVRHLQKFARDHNLFRLEAELTPASADSYTVSVTTLTCLPTSETTLLFEGNTIYDDSALQAWATCDGPWITPKILQNCLNKVVAGYHADGYDLADIKNVVMDCKRNIITVTIDEAIIFGVDVENNVQTRSWFIRSHFPLKTLQPYSTTRAAQGIRNIYGTDLFNRVTVNLMRHSSGPIVKIGVEEKYYRQVRLGWHWDDEYDSEEFIELLHDNVMGMGLEYLLHAQYAPARQKYFGSFRANRIWSTYLTTRIELHHDRLKRQLFTLDGDEADRRREIKNGGSLRLGQHIERFGMVTAAVGADDVQYRLSSSNTKAKFGLRTFTLSSSVDNLDRLPFPERGNHHYFELQFAGEFLGGDVQYTRFFSSVETFFPIGKYLNFHPRVMIGMSGSGLPPSEKFYLGGIKSFAGFRTYELTGDKVFAFSNEFRFKLPLRFYLTLRHDLGEVYEHTDQIKLRNLRSGVGAILAFDSPIGPVEFAYGVVDSDTDRIYINVGFDF